MLGCKESFGGEGFVETGSGIKREVWEGESGVGGEGVGGCLGGGSMGVRKARFWDGYWRKLDLTERRGGRYWG